MDLQILKQELAIGSYMGDDVVDAALLNAAIHDGLRPLSSAEILAWSGRSGRAAKLQDAATVHTSGEVRSVAWVAVRLVERDGTTLDLRIDDRKQMLSALVSGGVLTQADSDALYALAAAKVSKAELLGLGSVTESDVANARRA